MTLNKLTSQVRNFVQDIERNIYKISYNVSCNVYDMT